MYLISRIEALPRIVPVTIGAVLIGVVGFIDYKTGYELSFAAFYFVPIFLLTWLAGEWAGACGALGSAASRTLADVLGGMTFPSPLVFVWNTGMRVVVFGVIAILLAAVRRQVLRERALARVDHLTGALNKKAFFDSLRAEAARSRRYGRTFTLAYLDLDNFKSVNDSLGHVVGDTLLQEVISIIRANVRESDFVARLGGDEFALLLPETDERGARAAVAKIQSQFAIGMKQRDWPVTLSIGAVTSAADDGDIEQIVTRADALMYAAKMDGKNTARFSATTRAAGERGG
ncbi:MAG TPA: GGDEF domain-containing protein [Spirochaetia bacterium]|nr:GGDEF domain-containing protein [Spirochaetia bacterium]